MKKEDPKIFNEEDITMPVMLKIIRAEVHDPEFNDCDICPMVSGYDCLGKVMRSIRKSIVLPVKWMDYCLDLCSGVADAEEGCMEECHFYLKYGAPECRNRLLRECRKEIKKVMKAQEGKETNE